MNIIDLSCKRCGTKITPENINIEKLIGKCDACGGVFGFADDVAKPTGTAPVRRPSVALPQRLEIAEGDGKLMISRRWRSPVFFFLAFFCLIWDGFLAVWYFALFATDGGSAPLVAFLFPILHVAVGFGLTYYTICGFLNTTYIMADQTALYILHKPMPWWGNKNIDTATIKQIYCEQKIQRNKNGSTSTYYHVKAVLNGEKQVTLVSSLADVDQALFIEQELERHLKITDYRVGGEMPLPY